MAAPTDEVTEESVAEDENPVEVSEEETSESESSTEEQTVSEEVSEDSDTPEKAEELSENEELTEEERSKLSVKAQKRFQKLSKKAKRADELEEEARTLREAQEKGFVSGLEPESGADSSPEAPPRLPWEDDIEKGETRSMSPEDYKRDVLATADWLVKARIGQSESRVSKVAEVRSDLVELHSKHETLNPKSENYDKELSTKLATLYSNQLKADPKARLLDFVDTVMDVRRGGEEKGKAEAVATLSEQRDEEALTPSTAETEEVETKFEDLSLDEQEQYLKAHGLWE